MDYCFEDCQFEFLNWLRGNNRYHGERDAWRINSYNMEYNDCLGVEPSNTDMLGIIRDETNDVVGRTRAKYFHHLSGSIKKFIPLPFHDEDYRCEMPKIKEKYHDAMVQTKYRESSVQTSPFEPDFIPDEEGKYLDLEIYSICRSIQNIEEPGQYEVNLIERIKRRRLLEKILNSCKTISEVANYRKIIETFEWEEWIAREEDIQYYQNLRLKMVENLLNDKNNKMRQNSDQKVLYKIDKIKKKCDLEMAKIENKYHRNLRKIEYKRKNIIRKYPKTDILLEHTKMDSELYAPQIRYGVHPKRRHFVGYKTKFDIRMEDLELKMNKPTIIKCPFAFITMLAKPKEPPKEFTTSFMTDKRLKVLYESLKYFRIKLEPKREAPKCLIKKKIFLTETIKEAVFGVELDINVEEEYQKCVYLQKLIKGRAVQSILYTGKEEFRGLIQEIDSTHSLRAVEALFPDLSNEKETKKAKTLAKQKYAEQVEHDETTLKTLIGDFEGSVIGPMFEFLEQELDRLHEQKRVQAIVMLAERERYKREAKEAGKRQNENYIRQQYVEGYAHMAKSTKDNISTYLENVILEEINLKASIDCRHKIINIARDLDKFGQEMIDRTTLSVATKRANEDKMISEIVDDFIFSSVHNQLTRQKFDNKRKKHINAINESLYAEYRVAQDVLDDVLTDIINDIVQCQSPEYIKEESLKEFIRQILKDISEDTINAGLRTFNQIMDYILKKIFSSDNYSMFMDCMEKKEYVTNVIIKELKDEIGYHLTREDKCFLDKDECDFLDELENENENENENEIENENENDIEFGTDSYDYFTDVEGNT